MDFNKKKLNRLEKAPLITQVEMNISKDVPLNFDLQKEKKSPSSSVEDKDSSFDSDKKQYLKEINTKHDEILSNRPIPNLLEGASEIPSIEDISTLDEPKMGVNLNQKKNLEKETKVEDIYKEGHVA